MQIELQTTNIGEEVRKMESDYISGSTKISKYVDHSLHDVVEKIYAYIHSTHISGTYDALGREKPFFDIGTAVANVWYRATDIDRKNIRLRANKSKDWLDSFLGNVLLQDWMRRERFNVYLNNWGRILARFGSAITKVVENEEGLHISTIPWNTIICDSVDFDANPKIEILQLTEGQLRDRINTHGYDPEIVDNLIESKTTRETNGRQKKDNKDDYYKVYETHCYKPLSYITDEVEDTGYVQQVQILSFVEKKGGRGRKKDYEDFTLYRGREEYDPYTLAHLIEEDGRTLSIGAYEHIFQPQWMQNHSFKSQKDQLDMANIMMWQTADASFLGQNFLTDLEQGDVMVHAPNAPLTAVNNEARNVVSWQNFAVAFKQAGNEAVGVSEAMLGAQPKSGTAWRQTEASLQESYNLFELMVENKGNAIEDLLRNRILPYFKKQLDTTDEVVAQLEANDIERVDARYIKNMTAKKVNKIILKKMKDDETYTPTAEEIKFLESEESTTLSETLNELGSQRFFKPSEFGDATWKEQFENMEWDVEVDITGESTDTQEAMTTLNTALQMVLTPGFEQNNKAQAIVGRILELTNAMSPVEYYAIPPNKAEQAPAPAEPQPPTADAPLPTEQLTT